jgi:hypothetical protein
MEKLPLKLSVPTATKEEIERGLAAACAVFVKAGVHPETAASGAFELEAWDIRGFEGHISDSAFDTALA